MLLLFYLLLLADGRPVNMLYKTQTKQLFVQVRETVEIDAIGHRGHVNTES